MNFLAKSKKVNQNIFSENQFPRVAIVIAAYNEEKVIFEKLESTLKTNYPEHLFHIFIGSDNSTDSTNEIVSSFVDKNNKITFVNFTDRGGKQEVLNKLFKNYISENDFDICVMTDANIIFEEGTINELVKHFQNEKIGLVCANIQNKNIKEKGISKQEQFYISSETI